MLKYMGTKLIANVIYFGNNVVIYATILRIAVFELIMIVFQIYIKHLIGYLNIIVIIIVAIMFMITMFYHFKMFTHVRWERDAYLSYMSKIEIFNYFTFATIIIPFRGITDYIILLIFPIVWFVIFNKVMWNTSMYPKV